MHKMLLPVSSKKEHSLRPLFQLSFTAWATQTHVDNIAFPPTIYTHVFYSGYIRGEWQMGLTFLNLRIKKLSTKAPRA